MFKKRRRPIFFFIFLFIFLFAIPSVVWSHAIVIEESPAPNSKYDTLPKEVKIVFGSSIDRDMASIRIIDNNQQEVDLKSVKYSKNQKEISMELPNLENGMYTVEYYAISSNDGHPIQGTYRFTVAKPVPSSEKELEENNVEAPSSTQSGTSSNETNGPQTNKISSENNQVSLAEILFYLMRSIYYVGLVLIVGWVFWWRKIQAYSTELKKKYIFWGTMIQMLHLVGLILMILIQLDIFASYGLAIATDFSLFSGFGLMWLGSLFLSLLGYILLFRNKWVDWVWILFLVLTKSLNAHAIEFEPVILSVASNMVHLLAASIWAAGLFFIITFWRKQRLYIQSFIPIFSKYAFHCFSILAFSGIILAGTIYFSAGLTFTYWGIFLLLKLLAVVLVVLVGAIIRRILKKTNQANLAKWVLLDFSLMLAIMVLVSILTTLNPLS